MTKRDAHDAWLISRTKPSRGRLSFDQHQYCKHQQHLVLLGYCCIGKRAYAPAPLSSLNRRCSFAEMPYTYQSACIRPLRVMKEKKIALTSRQHVQFRDSAASDIVLADALICSMPLAEVTKIRVMESEVMENTGDTHGDAVDRCYRVHQAK